MILSVPQYHYIASTARNPILNNADRSLFFSKPSRRPTNSLNSFTKTCSQSSLEHAFQSSNVLLSQNINKPDCVYAQLLELCANEKALLQGRQIHGHIIKSDFGLDLVFLKTKLVFMYGQCGSVLDAEMVFDEMPERSVFAWNAMLGCYVSNERAFEALEMYRKIRHLGVCLDSYTLTLLLKACRLVEDLSCGVEIHGLAIKLGFDSVVFIANSLVAMYAKCDDLNAAKMFDRMDERSDVVSWNSMISAYSRNRMFMEALGLFREMKKVGVVANSYTVNVALRACNDSSFAKQGMAIHAATLKSNQIDDVYVANALLAMYVRFGKVAKASAIFRKLESKDIVTWNSMLTGFIQNGLYSEALQLFYDLQDSGFKPDQVSLISSAVASGRLGYLLNGKELHAYAIKNGFDYDVLVANTIVDMYAKCGCMSYASCIFDRMPNKDVISWTTAMTGFAQNSFYPEAVELLRQVQMEGIYVNATMVRSILLACSGLNCLRQIKEIHGYTIRQDLSDAVLQNALVDAYGGCSCVDYAARMFESIKWKDVASYTSMTSTYVHNGLADKALEVFYSVKETDLEPDSIALISTLSAVSALTTLRKGKEIHGFIIRKGFSLEGSISNALVDMYTRCGSLDDAYKIFNITKNRSLILWTAMMNAYGMHGQGEAAIELFTRMKDQNLMPDHITFLTLFYACSHSGLVDEGERLLQIMKDEYQLEPWPEHYACLVDLLGRRNRIEDAYQFVKKMKNKPTPEIWSALLGACRVHLNKEIGEIAAQKLLESNIDNPGNYVLVSNVFAANGRWEDVEEVRMKMKGSGLTKNPGSSWIEVKNKIHAFHARDKSHPECDKIYQKLADVTEKLEREESYVPQTKFVLHNVGEEEKVQMLYGHSERLAIAYGLLSTADGTPIRITKNLRICGDCHSFCRLVSKTFERELIVRDASRFHRFKDGVCSCGDFW